jgi:hypothetical protein
MPPSSLEDRVSDLLAKAAAAKSQAELEILLPQLRAAIQDQIAFLRARSPSTLFLRRFGC